MPDDDVFVTSVLFGGFSDEGFDACSAAGLIGEFTAGEEFAVCVFG